ncbi:hypothetical protein BS50DRAFT_592430 [Corynespora cassiicola Philippines]|uniref:Apple domain-containing protein n=1 Tax=Corynespora cassiicola Philippines TaxID=1448308 RepID=A0A2T2N9Y2_CORCC|nr:hypothetical protein BS50DRAFT_592430 [Corynespora cassiicola Philippines]
MRHTVGSVALLNSTLQASTPRAYFNHSAIVARDAPSVDLPPPIGLLPREWADYACTALNNTILLGDSPDDLSLLYHLQCGIDHYGGDIDAEPPFAANLFQCLAICDQVPKCVAVSFIPPGDHEDEGPCYIKKTIEPGVSHGSVIGAVQVPASLGKSLPTLSVIIPTPTPTSSEETNLVGYIPTGTIISGNSETPRPGFNHTQPHQKAHGVGFVPHATPVLTANNNNDNEGDRVISAPTDFYPQSPTSSVIYGTSRNSPGVGTPVPAGYQPTGYGTGVVAPVDELGQFTPTSSLVGHTFTRFFNTSGSPESTPFPTVDGSNGNDTTATGVILSSSDAVAVDSTGSVPQNVTATATPSSSIVFVSQTISGTVVTSSIVLTGSSGTLFPVSSTHGFVPTGTGSKDGSGSVSPSSSVPDSDTASSGESASAAGLPCHKSSSSATPDSKPCTCTHTGANGHHKCTKTVTASSTPEATSSPSVPCDITPTPVVSDHSVGKPCKSPSTSSYTSVIPVTTPSVQTVIVQIPGGQRTTTVVEKISDPKYVTIPGPTSTVTHRIFCGGCPGGRTTTVVVNCVQTIVGPKETIVQTVVQPYLAPVPAPTPVSPGVAPPAAPPADVPPVVIVPPAVAPPAPAPPGQAPPVPAPPVPAPPAVAPQAPPATPPANPQAPQSSPSIPQAPGPIAEPAIPIVPQPPAVAPAGSAVPAAPVEPVVPLLPASIPGPAPAQPTAAFVPPPAAPGTTENLAAPTVAPPPSPSLPAGSSRPVRSSVSFVSSSATFNSTSTLVETATASSKRFWPTHKAEAGERKAGAAIAAGIAAAAGVLFL